MYVCVYVCVYMVCVGMYVCVRIYVCMCRYVCVCVYYIYKYPTTEHIYMKMADSVCDGESERNCDYSTKRSSIDIIL